MRVFPCCLDIVIEGIVWTPLSYYFGVLFHSENRDYLPHIPRADVKNSYSDTKFDEFAVDNWTWTGTGLDNRTIIEKGRIIT